MNRFWKWLRNLSYIDVLVDDMDFLYEENQRIRKQRDDLVKAVGNHGKELQRLKEQRLTEMLTHASVVKTLHEAILRANQRG